MSEELLNEDNFLELSDEEILNMDLSDVPSSAEAEGASAPDADSGDVVEDTTAEQENDVDDSDDDDDDAAYDEPEPSADAFSDNDEAETVEVEDEDDDTDTEDSSDIDYKAEYEKLLKPFKANGKEIKVDSVDEAIQLMQMGANYNKKMQALKPNLKLLKMLENNGLLDESKLNYLIDLDKKNPEAIKHLLKDSGIDPLDVDINEQTSYKANTYTVDEREVELDAVLEEIQDTSTYSTTIDLISNKWDEASRKVIIEHPQIIKLINEHMQNGIYAQISAAMEKERMLGRLNGLSDIQAYRKVGDDLFASGKFSPASTENPAPIKSTPKPKKQPDPKVTSRKRAAAPTKSAPASSMAKDDFNPLSLSDDEFEKLVSSKFL